MKKITLLLTLLVSYAGFAQFPAPYCGITFTNGVEPITSVNFAGIVNTSSAVVGADNGTTRISHEDYTSMIGNVTAGSSYPIVLKGNTDGSFTTRLRLYADWNHDGDFLDSNEAYDLGNIVNSTGTDAVQLTANVQVPPDALPGNTRIRIIKKFNVYSDSCNTVPTTTNYGQAEDYTLTVAPLPADLPDYVNLQFPTDATINIGGTATVYGRVYEPGLTDTTTGRAPGINAWVGISPLDSNTNPNTWTNWVPATFNVETDGNNNDEYQANIGANLTASGTYYYATRFQLNGGAYVYGGLNFGIWDATTHPSGVLNVNPPLNDECDGAVGLTVNPDYNCGTVTAGSVAGATASGLEEAACGGTEDDDVWFSFEATSETHRISLTNVAGSVVDMYHSLWTGDCNSGLTLVAGSCSDANTSNPTGLTVGQTYFVRVYTFTDIAGQNSTFNICIGTPPPPPANDECDGAVGLTVNPDYNCGTVTAGTVGGATASNVDPTACGGTEDDDVWYSFEATATSHRISLINIAGSTTDMYHSLWTGDCDGLTLVTGTCSDAETSNPSGLTVGQTYFVRVYTWTGTAGQTSTFNICIGSPPPPPANDDCNNATVVTCGSTTAGTTASATNEGMAVCGIEGVTTQNAPGVWYKYVGDGSDVTVNTCSPTITSGDSRIAIFTGSCGTLTCIAGNDDASAAGCATNGLSSAATFGTVAGTDYYILVYSYTLANPGTNPINFELNVTCTAACSPVTGNDECSTAQEIIVGAPAMSTDNSCATPSLVAYPTCGSQFGTYFDTWYAFQTESTTGDYTITLANPTGTTGYALYSGDCDALTMVANSCSLVAGSTTLSTLTPDTVYYLRAFSAAPGARGSFDLSITSPLATGSFDSANFTYHPNPVKNILNLSYKKEISNIEVFNLLGQKVMTHTANTNDVQLDMSNLSNGAYMVKVTSDNQVKTIKVIKQ